MNNSLSVFCITDKLVQYTFPVTIQNVVDMDLIQKYIEKAQQANSAQSSPALKASFLTAQEVEQIIRKHSNSDDLVTVTHDRIEHFEGLLTESKVSIISSYDIVDRSLEYVPINYICFDFVEDKILIASGDPDSPIEQLNSLNDWASIIKPIQISYHIDAMVQVMLEAKRGFIIDPVEIKHVASQPMQYTFTVRPENLNSINFKTTLCTACSKWDCLCSENDLLVAANNINELGF